MIAARGLAKSFGAVAAVREVSFTAADGCITGLLGPNGAGKSTTLRMLCTVLRPDAGEARIDGHDTVADPLAARARLGVLAHGAGLYPNLTARENIHYYAALQGLGSRERRERTAQLLRLLELEPLADRPVRGFSQGERVRTALARALVHAPGNVVLDEPTNGLDVPAVRTLRRLLGGLRESGHCVLFSSHVMQEVSALCDTVVVIAGGTVRASGTPQEIRALAGGASLEDAFVRLVGPAEAG